jgi:hypothetical protein
MHGGKFKSQWEAVKPAADLSHHWGVGWSDRKARSDGTRPLAEQHNRREGSIVTQRYSFCGIWYGEWFDVQEVLASNVQWCPAGGQYLQCGAASQETGHQICHALPEMLAVIKKQQHLTWSEDAYELIGDGLLRTMLHAKSGQDRIGNQQGIGHGSEIDPGDAISEAGSDVVGDGQSEARFPDAARAGHRQERDGRIEQRETRGRLLHLTADEARTRRWEGTNWIRQ